MTRIQTQRLPKADASKKRSLPIAMTLAALLAGCSKGAEVTGAPQPPAPAPSNATAYIGTQSPGIWTMNVDDTTDVFSYQSASGSPSASGGLRNSNGVLDFGNQGGVSLGKAVEQPGVGALLRPGSVATFPVAMVPQSDCLPIAAKTRYIYTALPGQLPQRGNSGASSTGFGTFVVNSSADGKSVSFTDVHNYVLTSTLFGTQGGTTAPDTENGTDPILFSANCTSANGIGTIAADPTAAFAAGSSGDPAVPNFHFNSSGAFIEDRATNQNGGWVGFAMPASPIKPSAIAAAGTYRGFFSESTDLVPVETEAVVFAQATDGTTNLVGGTFPNDDVTQAPASSLYTITLGASDAVYNGVFPNAKFVAIDTNGYCSSVASNDPTVKSGFDANGNVICTALGVGVVSQIDGKYVIYFTSHDGTQPSSLSANSFVIQFYLYQQ